ncbi:HpcH/HpaI aldolase/citrate lyase family protein [Labedaea rhizosphaerae]|uniref:Citrate lyase subunit beta/citryl-CoA lyase n=1 Tax=Labedaea rhizosphaerae TaxID=598644 RepID=A0A4R6SE22_LABRH|nr:CoA ester lyase [Labedaea rhizosphaerae]TDP98142.1 citrate lyase subunit beta/citryl-CoA lyase [Labedaea rhizosphaerae]
MIRSLLFVPGNRPGLFAKVARVRPDAVVADLEDAVAPAEKPAAREAALDALAAARPGAGLVLVRVNPPGTSWFAADLAAVAEACARGVADGVVLPKYESAAQLQTVRAALPAGATVVVGVESALGVADARSLLAAGPDAAYFGAEDYIADLGGRRTPAGTEALYARSAVGLAARLAGVPAIDEAVVDVRDEEAFRRNATDGRNIGYRGKICIHPSQVVLAHEVFTPTAAEVAEAEAVVEAEAQGVAVINGRMVDAAHVKMAREVLRRTGR